MTQAIYNVNKDKKRWTKNHQQILD
jgi:hypothetical protein